MTQPRSKGRTGRPYVRARKRCLELSQVCWICGSAIDLTITDRKDPGYPTADHVIPVSMLPANDPRLNSVYNLRPAHMGCNSKRGAAKEQPKLKLSRNWHQ